MVFIFDPTSELLVQTGFSIAFFALFVVAFGGAVGAGALDVASLEGTWQTEAAKSDLSTFVYILNNFQIEL